MEFSRPQYWSRSLSLLQGIFPTQGLNWGSPALQADSLPAEPQGEALLYVKHCSNAFYKHLLTPHTKPFNKYYKLYFTDEEIGDTNNLLRKTPISGRARIQTQVV